MRRVAVILLALGAGCGANHVGPDPDINNVPPDMPCSDLTRAVYHWQGRDYLCDKAANQRQELIAIGDGMVLDWFPDSGRNRLWQASAPGDDGAPPLGDKWLKEGSTALHDTSLAHDHLLYSLGGDRLLDIRTSNGAWNIFSIEPLALTATGPIGIRIEVGGFDPPRFWGEEMLALDDDYLLRWSPGTGKYTVLHFDRANEKTQSFTDAQSVLYSGNNPALLRGAQLVNLGHHRLLEWIPRTGQYRIWPYRFEPAHPEIFDLANPPMQRQWSDRAIDDQILVIRPDQLLIWNRGSGRITVKPFDPDADDPLGDTAKDATKPYPELISPDLDPEPRSAISHLVLVIQNGRSFDSYFGQYCRAALGSLPSSLDGRDGCEAMPASIDGAPSCTPLDVSIDEATTHFPRHGADCLAAKINGTANDRYATAPGGCGDPRDFACAGTGDAAGAVARYHALAMGGALADHFFQSTLDDNIANVGYLSSASWNQSPFKEAGPDQMTYVLAEAGVRLAFYFNDPYDKVQTFGKDPPGFHDAHWTEFRWREEIHRDIALGQLAAISVLIQYDANSEEPGLGPAEVGIKYATDLAEEVIASKWHASNTLVLIGYLTSGGFYDHVAPPSPPDLTIDSKNGQPVPYGPRVPLLAVGQLARPNHVSHVPLELSSLVVFTQWNWLRDMPVGRLGKRDLIAHNIGDLLDPSLGVPSTAVQESP